MLFEDDSAPPSSASSAAATATENRFTFNALQDPSDEPGSNISLSASHGNQNCEEGWWRGTGENDLCLKAQYYPDEFTIAPLGFPGFNCL
ncbi:hypothetical protein VitviT2T_014003 [Vitis vinifera]|uniref:Uncharacterized protein n=1 Tax=Vitis vinifera TaxID=29760 RepID=A0ABY9CIE1_VITVI|nr:hypothetical protein VitviT2T_014003 [Vitis vinifera]